MHWKMSHVSLYICSIASFSHSFWKPPPAKSTLRLKEGVPPSKHDLVPCDAGKHPRTATTLSELYQTPQTPMKRVVSPCHKPALCTSLWASMEMRDGSFTNTVLLRSSWQSESCQLKVHFGCGWELKHPELAHAWLHPTWSVLLLSKRVLPRRAQQTRGIAMRKGLQTEPTQGCTELHSNFKCNSQAKQGCEDDQHHSILSDGQLSNNLYPEMHKLWEAAKLKSLLPIWKLDIRSHKISSDLVNVIDFNIVEFPTSNFVFCPWYSIITLLQSFLERWKCVSYLGEHTRQGKDHKGIWVSPKGRWEELLEEIIGFSVSFWRWRDRKNQKDWPDFSRSWRIFKGWLSRILFCLRHFHHLQTDCFKSNPQTTTLLITRQPQRK